jgi:hypothetical protein
MKIPQAAPTTENPIQHAIPKLAHMYGDVVSRNWPKLKLCPWPVKRISVILLLGADIKTKVETSHIHPAYATTIAPISELNEAFAEGNCISSSLILSLLLAVFCCSFLFSLFCSSLKGRCFGCLWSTVGEKGEIMY